MGCIRKEDNFINISFNFAKATEESNGKNLFIIHNRKLVSLYIKKWQDHAQNMEVYAGRERWKSCKEIEENRRELWGE